MEETDALLNLKVRGTSEYKKISLEEMLKSLTASVDGPTESEVGSRLGIFGYNVIAAERKNLFLKFFLRCCRQQSFRSGTATRDRLGWLLLALWELSLLLFICGDRA
jgi:hypothetical protein